MKSLFLAIVFATFCYAASGQLGQLDFAFGNQGIVRTDFESDEIVYDNQCQQILLHPNGSFYLIFEMNRQTFIVHRLASGALDYNYGNAGYSVPVFMRSPHAIIQPDGKIVVGGTALNNNNEDFVLARFNSNGSLDFGFSVDGKAVTDFSSGRDDLYALTLQSDGKIVAAGRTYDNVRDKIALARYNTDGSPDNNFSGDGKQITGIIGAVAAASVAVQNDGKIVIAGYSDNSGITSMAIARYSTNGELDNTFSGDGFQTITSGWNSVANAVVIQNDGKIVVGGLSLNSSNIMRFFLARLNSDGSYDNSFSDDGIQISDFGGNDASIQAMAIQNDSKIVIAGFANLTGTREFAVGRYNTDGSPDNSFSDDGILVPDVTFGGTYPFASATSLVIESEARILVAGSCSHGTVYAVVCFKTDGSLDNNFDGDGILRDHKTAGNSIYNASAVQADGKIVAAGTTGLPFANKLKFAIARYNTNGSLDNSFSEDGMLTVDFAFGSAEAFDIAVQPDGKILITGSASNGSNTDFALLRLNADGSFDNNFAGNGMVMTDVGGSNDGASGVSIQADGKIVLAGYSDITGDDRDFSVVRYNKDGSLDNSFSVDGKLTTDFNGFRDQAYDLLIQPDGKIIAVGTSEPVIPSSLLNSDIAVARFNANGSPDLSFDGDGKLTTDIAGEYDRAFAASLLPDGNIVVGGGAGGDFELIRFTSNGTLDHSFSGDGKLLFDLGTGNGWIQSLLVRPNGTIIAAGYVVNGFHIDLALAGFNADGTPAINFGNNGKLIMDLGYGEDRIQSLSIQGNHLYAAGSSAYGGQVGLLTAFLIDCSINVTIPDAITLSNGVHPNTVYIGYMPASDLTLMAQPSGDTARYSYLWSNGETTQSVTVSPFVSTTYSVTITDASGCSKTASKLVNVMDIRCGNKLDKVLICQLPGKSSNDHAQCVSVSAVSTQLNKGAYLGNCKLPSMLENISGDETLMRLNIYPNPSYSAFTLVLRSDNETMVNLIVWDELGRIMERRRINPNQIVELGISYKPGIYFAELTQGNNKIKAKLFKRSF